MKIKKEAYPLMLKREKTVWLAENDVLKKFQTVEKFCGDVEKKPILTTPWLCTMATGKGQGTQNWSHTEAYDDGP